MSESPFQKPNLQNGKDTHFERVYYLRLIVRYTVNPSWPFKMMFYFHDFERSDLTYHLNIIVSTTPVGSLVCLRMQGSRFAEDLNGLGKPVVHVVVVGAQEVRILKESISLLINICVAVKRRSLTLSFVFCVQHNHLEVLVFSKFIFILLLLTILLLLLLVLFSTSLLIFVDGCMIILIAPSFLKNMML